MKSQFVRTILLSAFVLAIPNPTFARGEGVPVYNLSKLAKSQTPTGKSRDLGVRAGGKMYVAQAPRSSSYSPTQVSARARMIDTSALRK
jgi:hypothetical protein